MIFGSTTDEHNKLERLRTIRKLLPKTIFAVVPHSLRDGRLIWFEKVVRIPTLYGHTPETFNTCTNGKGRIVYTYYTREELLKDRKNIAANHNLDRLDRCGLLGKWKFLNT